MGVEVFAGVLDANGTGAQQLREFQRLQVLQLDVTDSDQVEAAHRQISSQVDNKGKNSPSPSGPHLTLLTQSPSCGRFMGSGEQRRRAAVSRGRRDPAAG